MVSGFFPCDGSVPGGSRKGWSPCCPEGQELLQGATLALETAGCREGARLNTHGAGLALQEEGRDM